MDAVQALLNLVNASSPEISRDDLFTLLKTNFACQLVLLVLV